MHRIEDIIRQLNAVSANIQPELADHLRQIQERLDRAHAQVARPQHATAPAAATTASLAHVSLAASANFSDSANFSATTNLASYQSIPAQEPEQAILVSASTHALELLDELEEELDALQEVQVAATVAAPVPPIPSRQAAAPNDLALDIRNQIAAQQAAAAIATPRKISPNDTAQPAVGQPHEPTIPHFLRGTTSPRPGIEPSPTTDTLAPHRADSRPDVVPLNTTMAPPPESASKLPLFESLWFRQAAPQSFTARIVDRLLQKMPSTVPAVLHFCQDQFSQADSPLICTQIAWELSRRGVGQVLLVDADFNQREISRQLGNVYLPGLSEAINLGEPLECLVRHTGVQALSWLPSGAGDLSFRKIAGGRLAEVSLEFRQRFQWICVHAGAAQDRVTAAWGRFCDYSYLIASMADDLGQPTKQVLEGLRAAECRVSGLITID